MKNKMSAKVSNCFLFLVIGFVMLSNIISTKAQGRISIPEEPPVTINLAGTTWVRSPQYVKFPSDGTFATVSHSYDFEQNGKVTYKRITTKPAGQELVSSREYDPASGEYRNILKTKPTIPLYSIQPFDGTYKLSGKSIHLEFRDYTVNALIYGDSMVGELVYRSTNERELWIIQGGIIVCEGTTQLCLTYKKPTQLRQPIDGGKFSAPANSPMIGTWKYIEYSDTGEITKTSTFIYSQNGVVESIHQVGTETIKAKDNWKYTAKTASSGILEEFLGDELVERGNVKFLSRNQLEYTITFSQYSAIGEQSVWTRQ
jgi:hypothetical protein